MVVLCVEHHSHLVSEFEELVVAVLLLESGEALTVVIQLVTYDSLGDMSSILAMPSVIEPWVYNGAIDGSGFTNCTVLPCQLLL